MLDIVYDEEPAAAAGVDRHHQGEKSVLPCVPHQEARAYILVENHFFSPPTNSVPDLI
jgi:hypothetical protein